MYLAALFPALLAITAQAGNFHIKNACSYELLVNSTTWSKFANSTTVVAGKYGQPQIHIPPGTTKDLGRYNNLPQPPNGFAAFSAEVYTAKDKGFCEVTIFPAAQGKTEYNFEGMSLKNSTRTVTPADKNCPPATAHPGKTLGDSACPSVQDVDIEFKAENCK